MKVCHSRKTAYFPGDHAAQRQKPFMSLLALVDYRHHCHLVDIEITIAKDGALCFHSKTSSYICGLILETQGTFLFIIFDFFKDGTDNNGLLIHRKEILPDNNEHAVP